HPAGAAGLDAAIPPRRGQRQRGDASMTTKELIKRARGFAKPFRVDDGRRFRLRKIDPGDTLDLGSEDKPRAKEALVLGIEALAELQDMLYAQDRWAVLRVFQAM